MPDYIDGHYNMRSPTSARAVDERLKPKKPKHTHKWVLGSYGRRSYDLNNHDGTAHWICVCGKRKLVSYD